MCAMSHQNTQILDRGRAGILYSCGSICEALRRAARWLPAPTRCLAQSLLMFFRNCFPFCVKTSCLKLRNLDRYIYHPRGKPGTHLQL